MNEAIIHNMWLSQRYISLSKEIVNGSFVVRVW